MSAGPRRGSLLVIFLTVFVDLLGFGMVLPLLPNYAAEFDVDEHGVAIGLLMSSFSAMQFLCAPLWGRLSDRVGRRPVLMVGLGGSAVCYLLFAVATVQTNLTLLFISRIGAGVAGATISTAQAYIADVTRPEERTRGMALIGAAFGLGFTFGPLLGAGALALAENGALSPWPGYAAAALSAGALLLAIFVLPESLSAGARPRRHAIFDVASLRTALAIPSIGLLLCSSFMSIFSFANLESTLALLLKQPVGGFELSDKRVLFVFAYIGLVLSLAQGGLVRRLAGRVADGALAVAGVTISAVGFALMILAAGQGSVALLLVALAIEVTGFSFVSPSINALVSRRSNPTQQGGILGLLQSASALARIFGPMVGVPLFYLSPALPFAAGTGLMILTLLLVSVAVRSGRDYEVEEPAAPDAVAAS